jgi:hypothetical protein
MSTINSYFNTRKSRTHKTDTAVNATKNENNTVKHFAAQAPQPIYEQVKKPTIKKQTQKKNSILYYLSPKARETNAETEIVETTSICQIRSIIPVLSIWNDILEEFDPTSPTNQLTQDSPSPSAEHELTIENMDISHTLNKARRRRLEEQEDVTRVKYTIFTSIYIIG